LSKTFIHNDYNAVQDGVKKSQPKSRIKVGLETHQDHSSKLEKIPETILPTDYDVKATDGILTTRKSGGK
jgi:methyl coenzyme M reductase subunit D